MQLKQDQAAQTQAAVRKSRPVSVSGFFFFFFFSSLLLWFSFAVDEHTFSVFFFFSFFSDEHTFSLLSWFLIVAVLFVFYFSCKSNLRDSISM